VRVVAALDATSGARAVLSVAQAISAVVSADVDAVHVEETVPAVPIADLVGCSVRTLPPPIESVLVEAGRAEDVIALVLGLKRSDGVRVLGRVARAVCTRSERPIILVPPTTPIPFALRRALVPVPPDPMATTTLAGTIRLAHGVALEVTVLRVGDPTNVPLFEDQMFHETEAWAREFLARYVQLPPEAVALEFRVGDVADEILSAASDLGADLIVLGWGRDFGPRRALIVRRVLERTMTPVQLIPVLP